MVLTVLNRDGGPPLTQSLSGLKGWKFHTFVSHIAFWRSTFVSVATDAVAYCLQLQTRIVICYNVMENGWVMIMVVFFFTRRLTLHT